MNKIQLTTDDLSVINNIVGDNKLRSFALISDNSSGIGYTIDLEFECSMSGRDATVRIPVCGSENW